MAASTSPASSAPPRRIVLPVYEGVDLLDVCGPAEMFSWANYQVDLVAEVPGRVVCRGGVALDVPNGLGDAAPADALWVPGGDPAQLKRLMPGGPYLEFVKAQAAASEWVCSVCEGALLLAATGLLDGYRVTTHWAFIGYLLANFPQVEVADGHPRFVVDRDRLTGGGIASGLDESLKLIELLDGTALAESAQQTTQYYPNPPVWSAIPNSRYDPMAPA